jgi:hypothetical protein
MNAVAFLDTRQRTISVGKRWRRQLCTERLLRHPHMLPTPRAVDVASSVWSIGPQATTIICGCERESSWTCRLSPSVWLRARDKLKQDSETLVGCVDIFIKCASGTGHN